MKVEIELPNDKDIDSVWKRALEKAKENNVKIEGNMSKGHLSIKGIRIDYSVSGRILKASTKWPVPIPKKVVENEIIKFFNS